MKTAVNVCFELIRKATEKELKRNANCTTCFAIYQPSVPEKLSQYKVKHNDNDTCTKNQF